MTIGKYQISVAFSPTIQFDSILHSFDSIIIYRFSFSFWFFIQFPPSPSSFSSFSFSTESRLAWRPSKRESWVPLCHFKVKSVCSQHVLQWLQIATKLNMERNSNEWKRQKSSDKNRANIYTQVLNTDNLYQNIQFFEFEYIHNFKMEWSMKNGKVRLLSFLCQQSTVTNE